MSHKATDRYFIDLIMSLEVMTHKDRLLTLYAYLFFQRNMILSGTRVILLKEAVIIYVMWRFVVNVVSGLLRDLFYLEKGLKFSK